MSSKPPRIARVLLKGFRGIGPETCLRVGGRHLMLLGDNGCGKSSIVDAVEYALTGDVKPLSKRGQRLSLKRHLSHVLTPGIRPSAQVDLLSGTVEASMRNGDVASGSLTDEFIEGARSGNFILRRRQLLSFLEAEDRERYQMLRPFVDLGAFDDLEAAAKAAAKEATNRAQAAVLKTRNAETRARAALELAEDGELHDEALLRLLNARLRVSGIQVVASLDGLGDLRRHLEEQLAGDGDLPSVARESDADTTLRECEAAIPTVDDLARLVSKCEANLADEAAFGQFSEAVLSRGLEWIRDDELEACPLCEQPIERGEVLQRIETRLGENTARVVRHRSALEAAAAMQLALAEFSKMAQVATEKWQTIRPELPWPLERIETALSGLSGLVSAQRLPADIGSLREACATVRELRPPNRPAVPSPSEADVSGQVAQDGEHPVLTARDTLKWMEEEYPLLKGSRMAELRAQQLAQGAISLHSAAEQARKSTMTELFGRIESDIKDIYEAFHPAEGLGGFRITMKDFAEGSVVLTADFHGETDEDPRAFYSEAHQDTLGLAVFLALCREWSRQWEDFRLVVLDDVLSSIDGPHRARVAHYIVGPLADSHQVLLTTHDSTLFERLVEVQRSLGKQAQFENKRVISYTIKGGPRLGEMQFDYDRLCSDLSEVPHDEILLFAGRLLDDLLNDLRFKLRLSVPAEPGERYAVGHLWGPLMKRARRYPEIARACDTLNGTTYMRNTGVHSQPRALQLSRGETLQFVDAVRKLYAATTCAKCGARVRLSGSHDEAISCPRGCLAHRKTT